MKHTTTVMTIQIEDKTEIERLLALLHIGLCVAIEKGIVSVEAAEDYLYSPYTVEKLAELGISPQLRRLVQLGTELEDVASLLPEKLDESLVEMQQAALEILQTLPPHNPDQQWVQTVPITSRPAKATNGSPIPTRRAKVYAAS